MAEAVVKDGRVYMRDAEGRRFSVPEADARAEIAAGSRLEGADEFAKAALARERGTLGQQALTGLEAAAGITGGGATLGLAAPIAEAIGGREYIDAAAERAEVNPGTRLAGDVLGAVGAAALSGGTGALGRAAALTPAGMAARLGGVAERGAGALLGSAGKGILGTAARMGAAGATEGAAYGLGSSLAKSVLEDTEWTADRALAGMRDGAVYGLAGGAAAGGLTAAGSKVVGKMLGGRTLKEAAEQYAESRAVKAVLGDDARAVARLTDDGARPGGLKEAAEWLQARAIPAADNVAATKALKAARLADAEAVRATSQQLDAVGAALSAERKAAIGEKLKDIAGTGRAGKAVARQLGKDLERATFSDAADTLASLDKVAAKVADTPAEAAVEAVRRQLTEGLTEAAELASPELASAYSSATKSHAIASALHEGAKAQGARLAANAGGGAFASMGGTLLGALAGVATGSISVGAITSVLGGAMQSGARRMIQERGAAGLLRLADHVASATSRIEGAAKGLAGLKAAPALALASVGDVDFPTLRKSLNADPVELHERIQRTIAPLAAQQPEVAMQMARQIADDHAWLQSKIPQPMGPRESLTPQAEKRPIPPVAQKKLVSYAKALVDPVSVLEGMSHGRVDWAGIEALKERRPKLWEQMQQSVEFACAQSQETIPYRRKIMLSLVFDFQADQSLGKVAEIQASSATPPPPPPIPGAGQAPPPNIRASAISSAADETEIHAAVSAA